MQRLIKIIRSAVCLLILLSLLPVYGIAASKNTAEWKTVISCDNFESAAYNGKDQYVVVGTNGDIRTSSDTIHWVVQNSGTKKCSIM